jgi:hypothetical protein
VLAAAAAVPFAAALVGFTGGPAHASARKPVKAPSPSLCSHIAPSVLSSIVGYQVVLNTSAAVKGLYSCLYKIQGSPLDVEHEVNLMLQEGVKLSGKAQEESRLDYIFSTKARFSPVTSLGTQALFFSAPSGTMDLNGIILVAGSTQYVVQLYRLLPLPKEVQLVKLDVAAGKSILSRRPVHPQRE